MHVKSNTSPGSHGGLIEKGLILYHKQKIAKPSIKPGYQWDSMEASGSPHSSKELGGAWTSLMKVNGALWSLIEAL